MSDLSGHERAQEMARGLCRHLTRALDESTPSRTMDEAREVAQLLALRGLDRLLAALAPYAHGAWPAPLRPVIERMQRGLVESSRAGDVEAFRRMDDELGLMARAIERVPLARPGSTPAARPEPVAGEPAAVLLSEALEGVPGERTDTEVLRRVRLRTPVAGALKAALDWLVGGNPARMRMWLTSDGSALDVTCEGIAHTGLQAAAEVLTSVGAHLGPAGERPGAWTVRVPIRAERETFLMVEQDDLQLAVPWHAVVRVRLIPANTIETLLRRQGLPVLTPLAVAARRAAEQPVVVVALGLKRACLVADRLVWRMSAEPTELPGAPPAPGIVRAVRSDDDYVYWVMEPEWMLRGVAPPPMAHPGMHHKATPTAPAESPRAESPAATPVPARPTPEAPTAELGPEHVETLGAMSAPEASAPPAAPPAHGVRRALVAEDSIAARIFLVRLLEEQGFEVHAVASAAELRGALAGGPWTLVCADGELPDAHGAEFMAELARDASRAGSPLVALVRDAADETAAREAGVTATLRKPFGRQALEQMLERVSDAGHAGRNTGTAGNDPNPREWGAR